MWRTNIELPLRIRIAGVISLCALGGFFISTLTTKLYGGSLVDEIGGVPPVMGMDANLVLFIPLRVLVVVGLWLGSKQPA